MRNDSTDSSITAVVLAAGLGSRLGDATRAEPKCLTRVAGTPILINALAAMANAGVTDLVIVVGHLGERIRAAAGDRVGTLAIRYVENPRFATTGTSESLRLALDAIDETRQVLLIEGDVFFEHDVLLRLLSAGSTATVLEPYNPSLSGTFADVDARGMVTDWVHERERAPDASLTGKFKTVNLTTFSAAVVQEQLRPVLARLVGESGGVAPLESAMRYLVRRAGVEIRAVPTDGMRWFEIDTLEDLAIAESIFSHSSE